MSSSGSKAQDRGFVQLTVLCTLAYFVSYISRINLGAAMVEIVRSGFSPEHTVALALSMCSVTYGAGQIVSGWLGDRCKPQNVVFAGFLITSAMNLAVSMLKNDALLVAVWAVNGFAQSLMWPPILAILTNHLSGDKYARACMWVSWGSSFGTIAVYAFSPVIISLLSYRWIFIVSGGAALIMAFAWKIAYSARFTGPDALLSENAPVPTAKAENTGEAKSADRFTPYVVFLIVMIMLAIVMQGALRDGVTNWMPTLVSETFSLDSSVAILSGAFLPIFHIICTKIASKVQQKYIPNELACSGVIFTIGCVAAVLVALVSESSVVATVVLIALLVGCMHGVNLMLICMVPPHFRRFGHVSLVSGILNSSTYIGSAISTYAIAHFSNAFGWTSTLWLWAAIAGVGMLICLGFARRWHKFTH